MPASATPAALCSSCSGRVAPTSVLAGGLLTGKYRESATGRMGAALSSSRSAAALEIADRLVGLSAELGHSAASLAVAFAAAHPLTTSTLVGATRPEQLEQSAAGVALAATLDDSALAALAALGPPHPH